MDYLLKIKFYSSFFYSETEKLIGTLSVSDLRGLNYASINNLVLPVLDFLAVCTKKNFFKLFHLYFIILFTKILSLSLQTLPKAESILNPITVTKDVSLGEAIKLIVENHIHRLWVINEDRKVDNVVSLTDLIHIFTKI